MNELASLRGAPDPDKSLVGAGPRREARDSDPKPREADGGNALASPRGVSGSILAGRHLVARLDDLKLGPETGATSPNWANLSRVFDACALAVGGNFSLFKPLAHF